MMDLDKLNSLLHYMKGAEPFSKTFQQLTMNTKKWCPFTHGDKIDNDCYVSNPAVNGLLRWVDKFIICCKFLDVNRYSVDHMAGILIKLKNPKSIADHSEFKSLIKELEEQIDFIKKDVAGKLNRFTCAECERLDEAIVCFQNYCFIATIIMAVSAVESRINELIRTKDNKLHTAYFKKATLGQLIQVFDDKQYTDTKFQKIKKLMPEKHKPLITLLNLYRVFSAHPKEEKITPQIAESVLHLSFAFMIDVTTSPYTKKQLLCK